MKSVIKKMEQIVPNVTVLNALRNSGYNNYMAIADIVDNSLEEDVESKNVYINIESTNKGFYPFKYIKICDDGSGMNYNSLKDAITLGSSNNSQKNPTKDLGFYGTGLKSASLSLGKRLVVKTKSEYDKFYITIFDLDELYKKNKWNISIDEGSIEEYEEFKKEIKSDIGTIIEISKLDRISNNNCTVFKDILKKNFASIFRYFIDEKNVNIFINNEKIKGFDPMYRNTDYSIHLSNLNESFEYKNKKYTFNAFYLKPEFKNSIDNSNTAYKRNSINAGLYIYRNYRLVGEHLDLGIIGKGGDGYTAGIRIELITNGTDDLIFGTSFNKMVSEKSENDIEQGFKDVCKSILKPYINEARNREKSKIREENKLNEEQQKIFDDIDKGINSNKIIKIPKIKGKNQKFDKEDYTPENPRGPQQNPNEHKKRDDIWMKTLFEKRGEEGRIFYIYLENGIHNIIINIDHIFWLEFLKNANPSTQKMFINWFSASSVALQNIKYDNRSNEYTNDYLIDEYYEDLSKQLRKLIQY